VLPPLRTNEDLEALIEGLKDGTIDMVTSDHNPIDIEGKKVEFEYAKYGTIGLESAFGALQTVFTTKKAIALLIKGKERFGIELNPINEGERAELTLFNPDVNYNFTSSDILSKSNNSIFLGHRLKGKVYGIIANNKISLSNE
jgi:dihydroorotase